MARNEYAVRVDPALARWARGLGTPSYVFRVLLGDARRGSLTLDLPDPGPGGARLRVWLAPAELAQLRSIAGAGNRTAAIRRLFDAGRRRSERRSAMPARRPSAPRPVPETPAPAAPRQCLPQTLGLQPRSNNIGGQCASPGEKCW